MGHPHRCTPQILPGGLALGPADTPALVHSRSGADRKFYLMVGGGYFANFGALALLRDLHMAVWPVRGFTLSVLPSAGQPLPVR